MVVMVALLVVVGDRQDNWKGSSGVTSSVLAAPTALVTLCASGNTGEGGTVARECVLRTYCMCSVLA